MWFTKIALKRPVTVSMVFVCAVVMGLAASRLLPLEFFPTVQFPGVFVQANYPGSTPEEIEKNITQPLEKALSTIGSVEQMQSFTTQNQSQVFMLFDWGVNAKLKGVEAREKIDAIKSELPDDLRRVFIFTGSTNDQPIVEARLSAENDLSDSYQVLNRQLKQRLERIPGVSQVNIHGVAAKTYQIELLPERIAAYHIDTNQLLAKLRQANSLVSAGEVENARESIRITLNQQFTSQEDIENFIVDERGLKLSDIAKISYSKDEIEVGRHLDRKYAVGIQITREADANLVETADAIVKEMKTIEDLPDFEGIKLFIMENQADGVVSSLKDIANSGLVGFILSSIVLFIFLRDIRLTLIVSLAVPFSLLITFAAMFFLDVSINLLSMMGLMLAIGMLVDNAVVVSESIFGYRQQMPDKPVQATLLGVKDVGIPVLAGTLTTAIVFLPNIIGEKMDITVFLSHVAITIIISLVASLFIATTIIPLCLSKLKPKSMEVSHTDTIKEHGRYSAFLSWMMKHPVWSGLIVVSLLFSGVIPMGAVKKDMFPDEESTRLFIDYHIKGNYELEKVEKAVSHIEDFLYAHQKELDIQNVYSFYVNNSAGSTLLLVEDEKRTKTNKEIREFIEKNIPKIAIGSPGFERRRSGGQDALTIGINGEDTETLLELAEQVSPILATIKGVTKVTPSSQNGSQEVRIKLNSQRLNQLGLSPQSVATTISIALRKQQLKTFRSDMGETDITVTFVGNKRASMQDLAGLPIELPNPLSDNNRTVRLDSIAEMKVTQSLPQITRFDRRTSIRMKMDYSDTTAEEIRKSANQLMKNVPLPEGYSWGFGRSTDREQKVQSIMLTNMALAILMIFIVMAALFESLILPLAVITSILYAVVGVFWYFLFTNTTLSLMGIIGILVLMGVVVNNGIVLVDRIIYYRKQGVAKQEAVLHAANDRFRPILMTVLTTILGLLPLSLGDTQLGGGGPPYFPMARAVIGGLGFSTITTLICLPVIYLFLDYTRNFFAMLWRATGQRGSRWSFVNIRISSR
ncbi:efflux RND transporter permease subunit [Aliikangiella sp. G2MR2-5]|uniref:efflux RND transporter permease subunit n=1 Tax=Aliikangiella sp. G2MR2-5 TaxID=2788943 RepID=UPI0018AA7BD6|nr:efflux RND transporter permease subunit [Aliikangiella sp. G2MR2-5]